MESRLLRLRVRVKIDLEGRNAGAIEQGLMEIEVRTVRSLAAAKLGFVHWLRDSCLRTMTLL